MTSPIQTVWACSPCSAPLYVTRLLHRGWSWSTSRRCSRCWPSSAKNNPSSSASPPGPAKRTTGLIRTRSPPRVTMTDRKLASRPTHTTWCSRCTASSSQSCRLTKVSFAPSPTRISTLEPSVVVPRWSTTTVTSAKLPTSRVRCAYDDPPSPRTTRETGLSGRASAGTVTTAACFTPSNASAATRSVGAKTLPTRASVRGSTWSRLTPSGRSASMSSLPSPPSASGSNRPRSLLVGVNRQASSRPVGTGNAVTYCPPRCFGAQRENSVGSSDRAFHLQLDQAVELEGVLHRQLTRDRLDEAAHDHRHRLVLGHAARHQVEQLVLADLADRRLVSHLHVVLADVDVRIGVGAADRVDEQRVALDVGLAVVAARLHLHQPAVRRAATAACDGLADDRARGVRRGVHHLGAGVLVLALAGERNRQRLAAGVLADHPDGGVLHRDLRPDVAVDPLHRRALVCDRALGDEVVDVVGPVLDRGVTHPRVLLHDDLDNRAVQRVAAVDGSRAAFYVVNVGVLVGDDQRPL